MNILENIGQAQMNAVTEQRAIPEFGPGAVSYTHLTLPTSPKV